VARPTFEEIWVRIVAHAGQGFGTKTGLEFTYEILNDGFFPSRTKYRISKSDFAGAYAIVPFEGPGQINQVARGPAYIWAVLHDRRISKGQW